MPSWCTPYPRQLAHLHIIQFLRVIGTISTLSDRCTQAGKESLGMVYASHRVQRRNCLSVVDFGQALDLLDVKNRIAFYVRDFERDILTCLVDSLGASDGVGIDHKRAFLALADMGVQFDGLAECHPNRSGEILA
jgi:hypothetical protein